MPVMQQRVPSRVRLWGGVGLAAIAWIVLYAVNEPFWTWLIRPAFLQD